MAKERRFVDGIESIGFMEGMVHLELFNYIAGSQKQKGQRPEMEVAEELIFTPQGFLRAFSTMQNLVSQLEKAGVVKKNDDTATPVNAEIVDDAPISTISPNWNKK
jgi:ribosomal protein S19E (S16A)